MLRTLCRSFRPHNTLSIRSILGSTALQHLESTTPDAITHEILEFCREIDPTQEPVYIYVTPEDGQLILECLDNVERLVKERGGEIQHGWIIWEAPGYLLDAVFHAVWRSPDGDLVDVTPQMDGETRILFLPDSYMTFNGGVVANRRKALSNSLEVQALIHEGEAMDAAREEYHSGNASSTSHRSQFVPGRNDRCP